MSSFFKLALDTVTHLTAAINGGNPKSESTTVTLELGFDPDAIEVKIWGDINPLDPGNAGIGETEAGAEWLPVSPDFLVALTTNPALKTLHVRVRDDVWNEATAEASIQIGEGQVPPPTPTPQPFPEPLPANGPPEPRPRGEHRLVLSNSTAGRVRDHASVRVRRLSPSPAGPVSGAARVRMSHAVRSAQVPTRVRTSVRSRVVGVRPVSAAPASARSVAEVGRRDGAEFIATLEALGIL